MITYIRIQDTRMLSIFAGQKGTQSRWLGSSVLRRAGEVDIDYLVRLLNGITPDGASLNREAGSRLGTAISITSPVGYAKYQHLHDNAVEGIADFIQRRMLYIPSPFEETGMDFNVAMPIAVFTYIKGQQVVSNLILPNICKPKFSDWSTVKIDLGHDMDNLKALDKIYEINSFNVVL